MNMSEQTETKTEVEVSRVKPVIVLPKGELSPEDLQLLRDNGFCVVEAEHPDAVRFMEPPPQGYTTQEQAAIKLCRYIVNYENQNVSFDRRSLVDLLCRYMIEGTPLARVQTLQTVGSSRKAKK